MTPPLIATFLKELESWRGTPWVQQQFPGGPHRAVKGLRGDCIQIIVAAAENAGIVAPVTLPPYNSRGGYIREEQCGVSLVGMLNAHVRDGKLQLVEHDLQATLAAALSNLEFQISNGLLPGDLLTFRFARHDHHIGVYAGGRNCEFWHAAGADAGMAFTRSSLREPRYAAGLRNAYRFS